jgi:hypothetical protein
VSIREWWGRRAREKTGRSGAVISGQSHIQTRAMDHNGKIGRHKIECSFGQIASKRTWVTSIKSFARPKNPNRLGLQCFVYLKKLVTFRRVSISTTSTPALGYHRARRQGQRAAGGLSTRFRDKLPQEGRTVDESATPTGEDNAPREVLV